MPSLAQNFEVRVKSRNDFGVGLRIGDLHYTMESNVKFSVENVNSFIADVLAGKLLGKVAVRDTSSLGPSCNLLSLG